MAQGKLKVKAKLPKSVKKGKKVQKNKGVTKRANRPVLPSNKKNAESRNLKKALLKSINENMEKELRSKSLSGRQSLTSRKKSSPGETSKKR